MIDETDPPIPRRRWLTYSLRSLAVFIAISAVALTRYASQIRDFWNGSRLQVMEIRTVDELHDATRSERAAMFCDVDWSINAALGRRNFDQFVLRWRQEAEASPARFYVLNLTDRERKVAIEAVEVWGLSATRGSGEILWIQDGKPSALTFSTDRQSVDELTSFAQRHFKKTSSQSK